MLFANWAELLACFVRALFAGLTGGQWWWRLLLREAQPSLATVASLLCRSPELIPAFVLQLEAAPPISAAFLHQLTTHQADAQLNALVVTFHAEPLVASLRLLFEPEPGLAQSPDKWDPGDPARDLVESTISPPAGPLVAPRAVPRLDAPRAILRLAALALARWPHRAGAALLPEHIHVLLSASHGALVPERLPRPVSGAAPRSGQVSPPSFKTYSGDAHDDPDPGARSDHPPLSAHSPSQRIPDPQSETLVRAIAPEKEADPVVKAPIGDFVSTSFGGVFFLLNLALSMGFYGDFSQPRFDNLMLSPWNFLSLLGRRLTGFPEDPLWPCLAALAGESDEDALADFTPPCAAWPGSPSTGEEWFDWLADIASRRLASALGVEVWSAEFLQLDGHVHISAERVDIVLSPNQLRFEVRNGGFDRNPGWIPSTGKIITFIYSQ